MTSYTDLERCVIRHLIKHIDVAQDQLKAQFASSHVTRRCYTGVGVYTMICVSSDELRVRGLPDCAIAGIEVAVHGLDHGAGFVLFLRGGLLYCLEGFTYDEDWPREIGEFTVSSEDVHRYDSICEVKTD